MELQCTPLQLILHDDHITPNYEARNIGNRYMESNKRRSTLQMEITITLEQGCTLMDTTLNVLQLITVALCGAMD